MTNLDLTLASMFEEFRSLSLTDREVEGAVARAAFALESRRRRRLWMLALAPAVLLVAGASIYVATRPSAETLAVTGIACVDEPTRGGNMSILSAKGKDPVELCAALWRQGVVRVGAHSAPPLVACSGLGVESAVFVYPTDDARICERLGQAALPPGFAEANRRLAGLQALQSDPGALCGATVNQVVGRVRREITRARLDGWSVRATGKPVPDACTGIVIDPGHRQVRVFGPGD